MPFIQQYGRLGWSELCEDLSGNWRVKSDVWFQEKALAQQQLCVQDGRPVYPEPVDWIQAHAQTIRWCLDTAYALRIVGAN